MTHANSDTLAVARPRIGIPTARILTSLDLRTGDGDRRRGAAELPVGARVRAGEDVGLDHVACVVEDAVCVQRSR